MYFYIVLIFVDIQVSAQLQESCQTGRFSFSQYVADAVVTVLSL